MRRFPLTVRFLRLKKKSWMFAPLAVFTAVILGATGFHFIEDLSWLYSFYMAAQTVTTVGYGDLPIKTAEKSLTSFLCSPTAGRFCLR